jgi:hypothetical protein
LSFEERNGGVLETLFLFNHGSEILTMEGKSVMLVLCSRGCILLDTKKGPR